MLKQGGVAERNLPLERRINGSAEDDLRDGTDPLPPGPRVVAPLNPACVVCGQENPRGLRLKFESEGGASIARWVPLAGWESFKGIVHGGVICAVLDEAMSQAIIAAGYEALTAEMRIRFRTKVSVDDVLHVRGWIVRIQKRKIMAEGILTSTGGAEKAHAWATFLKLNEVRR